MFGRKKRQEKKRLAQEQKELAQQQEQAEQELLNQSVADDSELAQSESIVDENAPIIASAPVPEEVEIAQPTNDSTDSLQESSSEKEETQVEEIAVAEENSVEEEPSQPLAEIISPQPAKPSQKGFFQRLKAGLGKTRSSFGEGLGSLFLGKKIVDDALLEELEDQLIMADVGIDTTQKIIAKLASRVKRSELADSGALYQALQEEMKELLLPCVVPLQRPADQSPFVILMVGVNGAGKTTTIGKLAHRFKSEGCSVMLAAGDTFRAAAVEQLQVWGERNDVPVIAQHTGADSASVIYDAIEAAKARNVDVVIADTAGRLHTKDNLMEELKKITRVMKKLDEHAPHEVMLVLDAGAGQNALNQAQSFNNCVPVTGLTITKLDGTAKGGIVFAIADALQLPIRFIGVGETMDDLQPFDADAFIRALFTNESE